MCLDQAFIRMYVPQAQFLGKEFPVNAYFAVDSRLVQRGDVFIALSGNRVDGHDFIVDAVERGAAGIMISHHRQDCLRALSEAQRRSITIVIVHDPKEALITLARAWRTQFSCAVVGITGSIGKTSTKEIITNILRCAGKRFIAAYGNQNTLIGISLNILKMRPEHEVAIFEMGINKRGEMAVMAELVRPTTAIITTIGHSHMEGLGSLTDIATEKRDIFKYFNEDNIGIINGDQPVLATIAYPHPIIKFGCKTTNQIQARKIQVAVSTIQFNVKIYHDKYRVTLPTNHVGRVFNVLAAIAVCFHVGIDPKYILEGVQEPVSINGRFEMRKIGQHQGTIINDCYNASPESMKAALLAFEKIEAQGPKLAVLGDMLELGVTWRFWHRQLGRFLRKVPSLQHVILVGENVKWTQKTVPINISVDVVPNWQEAITKLNNYLQPGCSVLVKGSRGIGLNNLVEAIAEKQQ